MKQYRPAAPLLHAHATAKGYQVCESEDGGIGPHHAIGPLWPTPKGAYRYADVIEERRRNPVSPLRVEAPPRALTSGCPPSPLSRRPRRPLRPSRKPGGFV